MTNFSPPILRAFLFSHRITMFCFVLSFPLWQVMRLQQIVVFASTCELKWRVSALFSSICYWSCHIIPQMFQSNISISLAAFAFNKSRNWNYKHPAPPFQGQTISEGLLYVLAQVFRLNAPKLTDLIIISEILFLDKIFKMYTLTKYPQ